MYHYPTALQIQPLIYRYPHKISDIFVVITCVYFSFQYLLTRHLVVDVVIYSNSDCHIIEE